MSKLSQDFKYKTSFAFDISKLSHEDVDKYIAKAGLEKLKNLMPESVNLEENPDLLGIVGNCAVGNRANMNGDCISNATAIAIGKNFITKFCDSNHDRNRKIGYIINAGFSDYTTNNILTEEEAKKLETPVNISLAILIWKTGLPDEFISLLENSSDPTSADYKRLSLSWELYFNNYDIAIGNKDLNKSKIVVDASEKEELESYLLANNGKGNKDGQLVYRVIKADTEDDFLIPAGVGLVEHPAADVKGIDIVKNAKKSDAMDATSILNRIEDIDKKFDLSSKALQESLPNIITRLIKENFTSEKNSVIANTNNNQNNKFMDKITDIKQINDEMLKECKASVIQDFVASEIKKADDKFKSEQEKVQKFESDKQSLEASLNEVKAELKKMQDAAAAKLAEETYNQRLSYFDSTYQLSDEERKAIASDIKDMDEPSFEKAKNKYEIFLKDKSKASIEAKKQADEAARKAAEEAEAAKKSKEMPEDHTGEEDCSCAKCKGKSAKASVDDKNLVDDALKNGKTANTQIPNAQGGEVDFMAKYADAFNPEKCVVTLGNS